MKVLFQGRTELLTRGGGDKVQIENTASELRKLGVEVDITNKIPSDYSPYDIVHVFQLDWTPESYFYAMSAKKHKKILVISPIHHSVDEVKKFDDEYVFGMRRISKLFFSKQHDRDTFKNVYRSFFNMAKAVPTVKSIFLGLEKMHMKTLSLADAVLVQTDLEANDLIKTYKQNINWFKVPNGVSEAFINPVELKNPFDFEDYIICVGRIEPRKNQLNIIRAVSKLRQSTGKDIKFVLVGIENFQRHLEYTFRFRKALKQNSGWLVHIPKVPYDKIPAYYKYAKVCASASWFETTGLTSLESLFMNTNAIASGDRAKEYLGDMASYCSPESVESIFTALKLEYFKPRPNIPDSLKSHYTWKTAAVKTLDVYNDLLKR